MKSQDRQLGMDRPISRRDLLSGMGLLAGSSLIPGTALANAMLAAEAAGRSGASFPPSLTGLRGNHPGSFDVAHKLAREGQRDWGKALETDADIYDMVVVGAGISGLSAAWLYQKPNPGARILILDNHDDFGGHAKRNEMQAGDRNLIGYGGSQSLEDPSGYSDLVLQLYEDRNDSRYSHVQARQPFGKISIANCDAAAAAWLPASVEQAHRAVAEIT